MNISDSTNWPCYILTCGSCVANGNQDVGMIINLPVFSCIPCKNAAGVGYFLIQILKSRELPSLQGQLVTSSGANLRLIPLA